MTDTDKRDPNAPPFCPVCAVRMRKEDFNGVLCWTCPKHGRPPKETPPTCPTCHKPQTVQRTGTMRYWICVPCYSADAPKATWICCPLCGHGYTPGTMHNCAPKETPHYSDTALDLAVRQRDEARTALESVRHRRDEWEQKASAAWRARDEAQAQTIQACTALMSAQAEIVRLRADSDARYAMILANQERIAALRNELDEALTEQERLRGVATELAKDLHVAVRILEDARLMPGLVEESRQCATRLRPISGQYIDRVAELEAELAEARREAENWKTVARSRLDERTTLAQDAERMRAALIELASYFVRDPDLSIRRKIADALNVNVAEVTTRVQDAERMRAALLAIAKWDYWADLDRRRAVACVAAALGVTVEELETLT